MYFKYPMEISGKGLFEVFVRIVGVKQLVDALQWGVMFLGELNFVGAQNSRMQFGFWTVVSGIGGVVLLKFAGPVSNAIWSRGRSRSIEDKVHGSQVEVFYFGLRALSLWGVMLGLGSLFQAVLYGLRWSSPMEGGLTAPNEEILKWAAFYLVVGFVGLFLPGALSPFLAGKKTSNAGGEDSSVKSETISF